MLQQPSIFSLTVQFEDVDAHGIVHHPNYLKYLERARYHYIKKCGYNQEIKSSSSLVLAASEIHSHYLRPATLEQDLSVLSLVASIGKSSLKVHQSITSCLPNFGELESIENNIIKLPGTIFWADLKLICIDLESFKPKSIPLEFKRAITQQKETFSPNSNQVLTATNVQCSECCTVILDC